MDYTSDTPKSRPKWLWDTKNETLTETAWERQMSLAGIASFEAARRDAASETSAGQKTIRKLLTRATAGISAMQRAEVHKSRTAQNLKGTTLLIPADTSAIITLRALLDATYGAPQPDTGANYQTAVRVVSKAVETELNFRNWLADSQEDAERYARQEGLKGTPKSLAQRLLEEEGLQRMALWRWKQSFDALNAYKWDTLEHHYCGDALITAVVSALPEVFEIHIVPSRGKRIKHVRMLPEFRRQFDDAEGRIAQMQITRKPMIARPKPWLAED